MDQRAGPRSWPKRIPRIKVFCTSPSRGITTHRAATSFWRVRATGFILMRKRCWYTASLTSATRTRICFAIPAPGVSISRDLGILLLVVAFGILFAVPKAQSQNPGRFRVRHQDGLVDEAALFLQNRHYFFVDGVCEFLGFA